MLRQCLTLNGYPKSIWERVNTNCLLDSATQHTLKLKTNLEKYIILCPDINMNLNNVLTPSTFLNHVHVVETLGKMKQLQIRFGNVHYWFDGWIYTSNELNQKYLLRLIKECWLNFVNCKYCKFISGFSRCFDILKGSLNCI